VAGEGWGSGRRVEVGEATRRGLVPTGGGQRGWHDNGPIAARTGCVGRPRNEKGVGRARRNMNIFDLFK
jgi:hypothetical protein